MDNHNRLRVIFAAAGFAAAALLDIFYFPRTPIFPDETRFLEEAERLVRTGMFEIYGARAWEMPGTALFFAPFVWAFGSADAALVPIRLAQAGLLAGLVLLVGGLAERLFDRTAGTIAALITAVFPSLLYVQGLAISETLFTTLFVGGLWLLLRPTRTAATASAVFALATLVKGSLTVLGPFLAVAFGPRSLRSVLAVLAIYVALLSPWWIRNSVVIGEFVPFTTSAGSNLFLGNNPANVRGGARWGIDADPRHFEPIDAIPKETERNRVYTREAIAHISSDVPGFLRRCAIRFGMFWNVVPNAPEYGRTLVHVVSAASFGPILLLAIAGGAMGLRRKAWAALPVLAAIAYFTLLHTVTIASIRYRVPIEPLLIAFASGPLAWALARVRGTPS